MRRLTVGLVCVAALVGCSEEPGKGGGNNAGFDLGENGTPVDIGSDGDASSDAGGAGDDVAVPNDAGTTTVPDGGSANFPDTPNPDGPRRIECDATLDEVYATPVSAGPTGAVLACAESETASAQQVSNRVGPIEGVTTDNGYTSYVVAYRTKRATGAFGVATMVVYIPDVAPKNGVVVAHHAGLAVPDDCAPSRRDDLLSAMNSVVLPWVGNGYPTVAVDQAGLGTVGVMGAANTLDLAHSGLDAAVAARWFFDDDVTDGTTMSVGAGLGAHGAYAMQALADEYAPDVDLVGAIGFATTYPRQSYAELLRAGGILPLVDGVGVTRAVTATIAYTDYYNLFGADRVREVYHPDVRDHVADAVESRCFVELAVTLATETAEYQPPNTIGQLIEPGFRQDVVDCLNGRSCDATAQAFVDRTAANVVPPAADGGELLFVTALGGERPNPQEQACLYEWLADNGKKPHGCLWSGANNIDITLEAGGYAWAWGDALLSGASLPPCPQGEIPACD